VNTEAECTEKIGYILSLSLIKIHIEITPSNTGYAASPHVNLEPPAGGGSCPPLSTSPEIIMKFSNLIPIIPYPLSLLLSLLAL
jgi:hypothetical protein